MTDSLKPAAKLADLLSSVDIDTVLPETNTGINYDELAVDRIELRQVAGISAGGRLELSPGCEYDFGPVRQGHGRLDDGQPDSIGFTLSLDADLVATVGPGSAPLTIDSEPVIAPTDVGSRIINAGSARFVVARPRPPRRRDGTSRAELHTVDPWIWSLLPGPVDAPVDPSGLFDRRRRLHSGPDDISYRLDGGGTLLWDRDPQHPLFGTAVVAMTDLPVTDGGVQMVMPAPVAVDLLSSPTMLAGDLALQLAVARHIIVSLATTVDPRHLAIELWSGAEDLDFINRLPHCGHQPLQTEPGWVIDGESGAMGPEPKPRRLVVVDRPSGHNRLLPPGFHDGGTAFLILTGKTEALSADADLLTLTDEATMSVIAGERTIKERSSERLGSSQVRNATPVGYAESMAEELVDMLVNHAQ